MFELKNLRKSFGERVLFEKLMLEIGEHEIVSILGPSGCGKTTLLRICCGLDEADEGEILLRESLLARRIINPEIGMLFQRPVLYPHLDVGANVGLGYPHGAPNEKKSEAVEEVLTFVNLGGFQGRNIGQLSGGEAQRVAFARALLQSPNVMLLDEPFASVDTEQRLALASQTRTWLKERSISAIHVTHDEEEANRMADRIIRWSDLVSH
ncbi:MAG: ATP-binding cassette domain-containing protein [Candidatus Poseidonia sp.]|nr:ATP-binding cassette domain-containing protein [Poseidonia sp.]